MDRHFAPLTVTPSHLAVAFAALILALTLAAAGAGAAEDAQFTLPPFADEVAEEFRAVGRSKRGGFNSAGGCTGTLIRPDVVLTAGHCAGPVREGAKSTRMFAAGWSRGDFVAMRTIVETVRHPAYLASGQHDPRFDVGLLFLDTPITEVAPLPLAAPRTDAEVVAVAGYHRVIPHLLAGRLDCPVLTRDAQLMRIDCPVISGNSGGPVLEPDGAGGWQVTAVVSSQERAPGAWRAIAVLIPQWVHDVLAER